MLQFQLIEKALSNDRYLHQKNEILQVGPGENTLEICLKATGNETGIFHPDLTTFYDCNNCPYRFTCKKGKRIVNGKLNYHSTCFHKIILLANSNLNRECRISNLLSLLHPKGSLVLFVHKGKGHESANKFSFVLEDIMMQINLNHLEVQSITNLKTCKANVLCLIAAKR